MDDKRKLGIIGGMGARAGAMLFKKIIEASPAVKDQEFIEIILHNNSAVPDRTKCIVHGEASPVKEILKSVELFNQNQVDVMVLACITSYAFLNQFEDQCQAVIIHPVKCTLNHILENYPEVNKVGLLATSGTLKTGLYQNEFEDSGVEVITLNSEDQEEIFMESVYMENGLKSADISKKAISLMKLAASKLMSQGAQLIIGGCTEVQIVFSKNTSEIPYVDTVDVTVEEVIRQCYSTSEVLVSSN